MYRLLLIAILCGCGLLAAAAGKLLQTAKVLVAPKGKEARVTEFVTTSDTPAVSPTAATVRWDDAGLTITFTCTDADIVAQRRPRDGEDIWRSDTVELFLDPGHTHDFNSRWIHVLLTAAGDIADERGPASFFSSGEPKTGEIGYTAKGLQTRVERTADGWRAELFIPWEDVGARPRPGDVWGFNLNRGQQPEGEYLCWSPTRGPFLQIHQWGHLIFADPGGQAGDAQQKLEATHAMLIERTEKRQEYVDRVTRGEGFMPWQPRETGSDAERAFRAEVERRKDEMLARRTRVQRPALLSAEALAVAKRNIADTEWGEAWFAGIKERADYLVAQPADYFERMIPALTPTNSYGFTCPNCVGTQSQEGMGSYMLDWDYREPEIIRCKVCGQAYPDDKFPETGRLECPRRGQTFTFYLNDAERAHPDDRSGQYAWKWVGKPIHVSFSGIVREKKILFMASAARTLALAYRLTGDPRYAEMSVAILRRFTECVPNWLYHDYWDTVADCDPLYAAWHDGSLPLEWKRHASGSAYDGDTPDAAKMLQSYWGAGRIHTSADAGVLNSFIPAYDLTYDAKGTDGKPLWNAEWRRRVERDLLLEYLIGAEPFLGGAGKAENVSNKAPYVYHPMAVAARALGLPNYADVALRGYEAIRDRSFLFDGFSRESPAYTNMYLNNLLFVPETLHGFRWPRGFPDRSGTVNVYRDDPKLRQIMRAAVETLRADGKYLPLSDTLVTAAPSLSVFEIGLRRYPEYFRGALPVLYRHYGGETPRPTEYAVFHLGEQELRASELWLPEILFPAWGTAILRHADSVLALPFNPPGGHRHADNLALYYADRGRTVLGELGYVGDSAMLGWGHSTLSHNLVVVDDREQRFTERAPSLRLFAASPRVSVVEAESNAYAQCGEYRRLAALLKGPEGRTLVVDIFRVRGGNKHAYRVFSEIAAGDARDGTLEFAGLTLPPERKLPNFGGSIKREHVFGLHDIRAVEGPPAAWQAAWQEDGRSYRLHALCPADAVEASHGPGQQTRDDVGRRLRYLDIVNRGEELASTFVTLHEPGEDIIRAAERLPVPEAAGPDAVALRIESAWGTYLIFSDFTNEAEVAGVRFRGQFAVFATTPAGKRWRFTCGEQVWEGRVAKQTPETLTADTLPPAGWPALPAGVTAYVLAGHGATLTGYPVKCLVGDRIDVDRFPLQPATAFRLLSVRYNEEN
jgi:hypothetical protein